MNAMMGRSSIIGLCACRLRKDVNDSQGDLAKFDKLKDVRALEYDVDKLTQKLKR